MLERPKGLDTDVLEALGMRERFIEMLREELAHVDAMPAVRTEGNDVVTRHRDRCGPCWSSVCMS